MTKISKKQQFNEFRFKGLNAIEISNKYLTMNRVNEDETKIVIKVSDVHLFATRYGYGMYLDNDHGIWLKDWQVSNNYFGIEVLIDKQYFKVVEMQSNDDFGIDDDACTWESLLAIAKSQQEAGTKVKWEK